MIKFFNLFVYKHNDLRVCFYGKFVTNQKNIYLGNKKIFRKEKALNLFIVDDFGVGSSQACVRLLGTTIWAVKKMK